MMKLLIIIPAFLVSVWLLVSPVIVIFWFFHTDMRDQFMGRHKKIAMAFFIGSFICIAGVLGQGFEEIFSFLPDSWGGYDEDGDFVTLRSSIAYTLSFFLTVFIAYVFDNLESLREENLRLKVVLEVRERMERLRDCSSGVLTLQRDRLESEFKKLRQQSFNYILQPDEKKELLVLGGLLDEIDGQIRKTPPS